MSRLALPAVVTGLVGAVVAVGGAAFGFVLLGLDLVYVLLACSVAFVSGAFAYYGMRTA